MRFESRATSIFDLHLSHFTFPNASSEIHHSHGFHSIEHCSAHRPCIHAQRAPDASRYPFQKLQSSKAVSFRLNRDRFEPRPRPATHPFTGDFNRTEMWL